MVDVVDVVPPAVDQTGNLTVWFVPTIADMTAPKAATELGAAGAFRITYSFTSDGYAPTGDQGILTDDRLTLPQGLQSLDKVTVGLTLKYVDSSAAGSAAVVLKPVAPATSLSGYLVERPNVPNATLAAAAQKVITRPVTLGVQIPGPRDGQGKFTYTQVAAITGPVTNGILAA